MFERCIKGHVKILRDKAAYSDRDSNKTYQRMADDIARCTTWLKLKGVLPGSRVALHITYPYLQWVFFFAVEAQGAISVALPKEARLASKTLSFVKAEYFVTDQPPQPDVATPGEHLDRGWLWRLGKHRVKLEEPRQRTPEDPICIVLSSGTTGTPKKVLLSRGMIDRRTITERSSELISEDSRNLVMLPHYSIGGLITVLSTWSAGGTICAKIHDHPADMALKSLRINLISAAPSHIGALLSELPEGFQSGHPVDVSTGGGVLPGSVGALVETALRGRIATVYGSTEMGYVARGDFAATKEQKATAGFVLPYAEVEIRDPHGKPVPHGEIGEIFVRGGHVVDSYLEDLRQTEISFSDGWYRPGDLGVLQADGLLKVDGRVDDLINYRGRKVLPQIIESRVRSLAGIQDVVAFSARLAGADEPVLWVACVASDTFEPRSVESVVPKDFVYVVTLLEALPRNGMGKIGRASLRLMAESGELQIISGTV